MENKRYLKIFETEDDYNKEMDSIMGDPHVVLIGNKDRKKIMYFDSSKNSRDYFTIEALEENTTISLSHNDLYYCIDNDNNWNELKRGKFITITTNQKIKIKIKHPTIYYNYGIGTFSVSKSFNVEGNIMSLLYGDDFYEQKSINGKNYVFFKLFENCKTLKNADRLVLTPTVLSNDCYGFMFSGCTSLTKIPILHATTLSSYCYYSMFEGCTSLTTAPELPAETLASYCYERMFSGCTSLTTAPVLKATTLESKCYYSMFEGCTSLTTAPELPAETLSDACYYSMFKGCTSLTKSPALPATTLASNCYYSMFSGCTSLTTAPALPATTLATGCYFGMFQRCTSLTTAHELPATTLASSCYYSMFGGCTSLTTAPELPATTLASNCYKYMFSGCTSLTTVPDLPAEILADSCYDHMFSSCESLIEAHELSSETLASSCYSSMFSGCTSLTTAPELPAETLSTYCYSDMFNGCTSLTSAPALPATTLASGCYYRMFFGCTGLTTAPELPATTLASSCYSSMFWRCSSLTTAPELPATTLANSCYNSMFSGCTSLTTSPELPATTLASFCYSYMFSGCTSLTEAPVLPATTLASYCYECMFLGCSNLNKITMLATDISASECLTNWVSGVASEGTFIKNLTLTSIQRSENGIPNGWVVYVGCVSPSFINTLNSNIYFINDKDIYTPNSSNIDLTYKYSTDELLSMQPVCDICIDIVYRYNDDNIGEIIKENHLWENDKTLNDILNELNLNYDNSISKIAIIIVDIIEPEESGYYYDDDNLLEYFTIEALENGLTVKLSQNTSYYRIDNDTKWTSLTVGSITPAINTGQKIQFKIENPKIVTLSGIGTFTINKSCNVEGNIMSLLYGDNFVDQKNLTGKNYAFFRLFYNCSTIKNAIKLVLPATTLESYCYSNMFFGCRSLVTAPELPAETLTNFCYNSMFSGCTSLKNAPVLPATTLASCCYQYMFSGCTSLTTAPELQATTLAYCCYGNMFYGCTSLTTVPKLPAQKLSTECYSGMFWNCTSLTTAPELPATKLANNCYFSMFSGCSNLKKITMLATDISASGCLSNWVSGVASEGTFIKNLTLTSIQRSENGIPNGWYVYVDCDSPSFINTLNSNVCFINNEDIYEPNSSNENLFNIGYNLEDILSMTPACDVCVDIVYDYKIVKEKYLWENDKNLDYILKDLNLNQEYDYMYKFAIIIVDIIEPEESGYYYNDNLFEYFTIEALEDGLTAQFNVNGFNVNTCEYRIDDGNWRVLNSKTQTTPSIYAGQSIQFKINNPNISYTYGIGTFAVNKKFNVSGNIMSLLYGDDFVGKTDLTGKEHAFENLFRDCTTIKNAINLVLPATTLAESCYSNMFNGCTKLETAPELPATTLADYCYQYMFNGCSKLNYIKMLATDISAEGCLNTWVSGVASTGTFIKNVLMNSLLINNINGIPSGWYVNDFI